MERTSSKQFCIGGSFYVVFVLEVKGAVYSLVANNRQSEKGSSHSFIVAIQDV